MTVNSEELRARGAGVRAFSQSRSPGFADCAPSGRVRLDALACWLQDIAYADVLDAGLARSAVWVVRRSRICVTRFPRLGERFELTTFCSGTGRMWVERRTDVARVSNEVEGHEVEGPGVQAVSLWIHLDAERWVPTPLTEAELSTYGGDRPDRRVSHRLRHSAPESTLGGSPWTFRATECDIADHVNNAAYWAPLEEELLAGPDPEGIDVEIEYRTPAQPGPQRVIGTADRRWIVGPDGELHASLRFC